MTALQEHADRPDLANADEELLLGDWLGLAGYLAEAVENGEISIETARAELAGDAIGVLERRALGRAAVVAATRVGAAAAVTKLLESAVNRHGPAVEVA
jgi:hypothetical protein